MSGLPLALVTRPAHSGGGTRGPSPCYAARWHVIPRVFFGDAVRGPGPDCQQEQPGPGSRLFVSI